VNIGNRDMRLYAATAVQSIAGVARQREQCVNRYFRPAEQAALKNAPDRTIAGRIAAKRAIGSLVTKLYDDKGLAAPRLYEIGRTGNGAPVCILTPAEVTEKILLSISHNQSHAWGLATAIAEKM
jgi:phosphopantetheinyl transferase (holo-ACP synthase)